MVEELGLHKLLMGRVKLSMSSWKFYLSTLQVNLFNSKLRQMEIYLFTIIQRANDDGNL